uniref:CCR4-NOT transcription complex subunit 2-like n=2 Tax=Saccoglossus kowalevskii TaxID=10224 RepID=A0ABM0MDA9_SACKO
MSHLNPMPGLGQFGMSQEARKSQPDLSSPGGGGGGGDKTKSRMGFYKDSDLSDQSVFFNPSIFPPHRPDKDLGSQSLSQFGASLYGQQSKDFQMFHHDQGSIGMQNVPRGMPNPTQQFPGRTVTSHHGNIPGHVTPTSTGVPTMPSGLQQHAPSSPNRGILSVGPTIGPRSGLFNQMPSSNQGITIPNRGNAMPSGLASPNRQSPSILAMQQKQQQQQQRLGLGTIGSNPPTSIAGFNITRGASAFSNQNVISSASQAVLNNSFTSTVSDSAPTLDLNDFPALNNRGRRGSDGSGSNMPVNPITMSNMSTMASRTAYGSQEADWTRSMGVRESITPVGMVNKQADPPQEFQIQNEDFPALPGSNNANSLKASS